MEVLLLLFFCLFECSLSKSNHLFGNCFVWKLTLSLVKKGRLKEGWIPVGIIIALQTMASTIFSIYFILLLYLFCSSISIFIGDYLYQMSFCFLTPVEMSNHDGKQFLDLLSPNNFMLVWLIAFNTLSDKLFYYNQKIMII